MAATPDRANADLRRRLAVDATPPPQIARGNRSPLLDPHETLAQARLSGCSDLDFVWAFDPRRRC